MAPKLLILALFLFVGSVQPAAVLTQQRFNETYATQKGARCMDGTTPVFYIDLGSGAGRNKWVFSIQGGGYCWTEGQCRVRANSELGSSANYPATRTLDGILSDDAPENPDFYTWNRVFLPYCSGDIHSGTRMSPSAETWGFHFSGHNIIVAMYDYLVAQGNLGAATEIIVNGGSAGAVGSWSHTEYTQSRFPSARVVNLPNAGYFSQEEFYPLADNSVKQNVLQNMTDVWQSFIPAPCLAQNAGRERYRCLIAEVAFSYFTIPRFWIQAVLDTNLLTEQLGFPGFSQETNTDVTWNWLQRVYAARMNKIQSQIFARSTDGYWLTSALVHGIDELLTCNQNNNTWLQTFGNWYFNRQGIQREFDECGPTQSIQIYRSGAVSVQASCVAAKSCVKVGYSTPTSFSSPRVGTPSPTGSGGGQPTTTGGITQPSTGGTSQTPSDTNNRSNSSTGLGVWSAGAIAFISTMAVILF